VSAKLIQKLLPLLLAGLFIVPTTINAETLPKGIMKLNGEPAPPLKLKDLDGEAFDIEKMRGKWVFVHFWAAWCGPCRREMPRIQTIVPEFENTNLEIVLVNTAETEDTVFEFIAFVAPDLVPLLDTDGMVTERWQPRGLPASFFVDPEGKLQYLALGGRDWDDDAYLGFMKNLIGK
jgi:thiol-disulfide isomerase/thioredoxin